MKLNSKGFTLVELLAVIIILAIVVGITIPAVLTTISNTREKAFQTAANSAADWFDRQYAIYLTGITADGIATLDDSFKKMCLDVSCVSEDGYTASRFISSAVMAAGLKTTNVDSRSGSETNDDTAVSLLITGGNGRNKDKLNSYVMINSSTGRTCVKIVAKTGGDYPEGKIACGGICTTTQCDASE